MSLNTLVDKGKAFLKAARKAEDAAEVEADFEECSLDDKRFGDKVVNTLLVKYPRKDYNIELYLARNDLTQEAIPILERGLRDCRFHITTLALRANLLTAEAGVEIGRLLTAAADGDPDCYFLTAITTLDLACNELGNKGARAISDALALSNCTLTDLDLGSNAVGPSGAQALADALEANTHSKLSSLELRLNNIQDEGAKSLAQALEVGWSCAVYVGLACNNLTEVGVTKLGDAVHGRRSMEELNVWGNIMSVAGINSIRNVSGPHIHYGWNENTSSMAAQVVMNSPYQIKQNKAKSAKRRKKAKDGDQGGDGGPSKESSAAASGKEGWDRVWRTIRTYEGRKYKERTLAKLPTRKRPTQDGRKAVTLSDKREAELLERISKDIRRFEDQRAKWVNPGMTREEQQARLDEIGTTRSKNITAFQLKKQEAINKLGYTAYDTFGFKR